MDTGLALRLRDEFKCKTFIETGSYMGSTAYEMQPHFNRVITIEADPELYRHLQHMPDKFQNVQIKLGESPEVLRSLLRSDLVNGPILFWLDAHWCGPETYGKKQGKECPLLEELAVLREFNISGPIMIDDAKMFMGNMDPAHDRSQWPNLRDIINSLDGKFKWEIIGDIIVCTPVLVEA